LLHRNVNPSLKVMTTLAALVGADQRGRDLYRPGSLYLASDSRISWEDQNFTLTWDRGRKLFASSSRPDLLGYVGDVFFPSLVLAQVTSAIDVGAMYPTDASPSERFSLIQKSIKASFGGLPENTKRGFIIIYATREMEKLNSTFHMFTLAWNPNAGWAEQSIEVPQRSSTLLVLGSGEAAVEKWHERLNSSSQGSTSRAVFSAFCDAVYSGQDPKTGGAPQLVGLYRIGPGRAFGVVHDGKPFVFGMPLDEASAMGASTLEWRNTFFERCDANGQYLPEAQRHHVPRGLGKRGVASLGRK
jgi:hypothetical protein